ncbi:Profilin [Entamoeba marina]
MSWQEYVDIELVGSGYCKTALILGNDGVEKGFTMHSKLEKSEITNITSMFGDSKKRIVGSKMKFKGREFVMTFSNERTIKAQSTKDDEGYVLVKTRQLILVVSYGDYITEEQCVLVVEKLADYLIQKGF